MYLVASNNRQSSLPKSLTLTSRVSLKGSHSSPPNSSTCNLCREIPMPRKKCRFSSADWSHDTWLFKMGTLFTNAQSTTSIRFSTALVNLSFRSQCQTSRDFSQPKSQHKLTARDFSADNSIIFGLKAPPGVFFLSQQSTVFLIAIDVSVPL